MNSQDIHKIFDAIAEVISSLAACGGFAKKDHIFSCKASFNSKKVISCILPDHNLKRWSPWKTKFILDYSPEQTRKRKPTSAHNKGLW